MARKKIIIIGGGMNGIAAALTLTSKAFARFRFDITVVEGDKELGGLGRYADYCYGLPPFIKKQFRFSGFSLGKKMATMVFGDKGSILLEPTAQGTRYVGDNKKLGQLHQAMEGKIRHYSKLWQAITHHRPPQIEGGHGGDIIHLAKTALAFKTMGKKKQYDFLKIITQNTDDFFGDYFADAYEAGDEELLTSMWNFQSYHGNGIYATQSGTMTGLWTRHSIDPDMGLAVYQFDADRFFAAAEKILIRRGVKIEKGKLVTAIVSELAGKEQKIVKVMAGGKSYPADRVLSTLHPYATMKLAGFGEFDGELVRRARHVRGKGLVAKIIMELKKTPAVFADKKSMRLVMTGGRKNLEYQFLDSKYDSYPHSFPITATMKNNKLHCLVFNQPLKVKQSPDKVKTIAMAVLKKYIPDLDVKKISVILPQDMGYGAGAVYQNHADGDKSHPAVWHHVDLTLDQLWAWRPINGVASGYSDGFTHYRTPLKGLYVGGASCHPGGDVHGLAGLLAAETMLKAM